MTTPFPFVAGNVLTAAQLNSITELIINDKTASYVLVAGDAGERVIMNSASATTITVNNSIFAAGEMIFLANKGAGTCTITAGAGVTINTESSLALAQYGGGTLLALSASTFIFFRGGGVAYGTATGGSSSNITVGGVNYTLLTFTSSGTLTVTKAGLFDCLVVGGGGSGGRRTVTNFAAGGGGGGSVIQQTIYLDANATVTVGAKGAARTSVGAGNRGTYSGIGQLLAGGGGGATTTISLSVGSGGGADGEGNIETTGLPLGANNGGITTSNGSNNAVAGGGGGSTAVGGNANVATNTGGNGGTGTDVSTFIGGSSLFHGAGGGGLAQTGTGGTAGNSTGGNGGSSGGQGSNATATNYGCGGGGGNATQGGAGADGVVYVRFRV